MAPADKARAVVADVDELLADVEPDSARRLLLAALDSFATIGYHATTTRHISTRSGLSTAALYVYYSSKEEVLFRISRIAHRSALTVVEEAAEAGAGAPDRVRGIVHDFTVWHARHRTLARVAQYEFAALSQEHYQAVADLRRRIEQVVQTAIETGVGAGEFGVADVRVATLALLSPGIDVARWYHPDGDLTPEALGEMYAEFALRMLRPLV